MPKIAFIIILAWICNASKSRVLVSDVVVVSPGGDQLPLVLLVVLVCETELEIRNPFLGSLA